MRGNADNRITEVESSADAQNWHHDARYFYSRPEQRRRDPHGPLQRVELGEHLVQGTDYAYTLQGWLKGINGDRLNPTTDMGRDGDATVVDNPNLLTGRDAYALSLGYYGDNDYKAIASSYDSDSPANIAQRPFAPIGGVGTMNTEHTPLYNGNIAHTVNTLQHFGLWDATNGDQGQVLAMVYRYDQLNRLRTARGLVGLGNTNTWDGVNDAATNRYRSEYTYDANGNIETAQRWNATGAARYDSLHYQYHDAGGRRLRNRLYHLQDLAADGIVTAPDPDDLKKTTLAFDTNLGTLNTNASTNNYRYDALGNLVYDNREGITNIEWTVAGKVRSVAKASGPSFAFAYGASGQRTQKQVGDLALDPTAYREHYIRDAQGNIMATYRYTNNTAASLKLNERPVYGSSRVGSLRTEVELHTLPSFDPTSPNPVQQVDLNYELTDHLGNVCAVVTGRLLDGNGGGTAKQAELVSAQGYEPFGSLLPGRNYSSNSYRFGFQGQEKDDEFHNATGTSLAFEARMYDPRLGRWLSLDPLSSIYPGISSYAYVANTPIIAKDPDGKKVIVGNQEALQLLRLTLSPEEAQYVVTNKRGVLKKSKLRQGLRRIGVDNVGNNFKSLVKIVNNKRIVEVIVSQTYETSNNGTQRFEERIADDYLDTWTIMYGGLSDGSGTVKIGDQVMNFDEFKSYYEANELGPGVYVPGTQGVTAIPNEYIVTPFDKAIKEEALGAGGNNYGETGRTIVTINKKSAEVNPRIGVLTVAHELFGHALMSVLGKSAFHGTQRDSDNQELENQIRTSVNEADKNYELRR